MLKVSVGSAFGDLQYYRLQCSPRDHSFRYTFSKKKNWRLQAPFGFGRHSACLDIFGFTILSQTSLNQCWLLFLLLVFDIGLSNGSWKAVLVVEMFSLFFLEEGLKGHIKFYWSWNKRTNMRVGPASNWPKHNQATSPKTAEFKTMTSNCPRTG